MSPLDSAPAHGLPVFDQVYGKAPRVHGIRPRAPAQPARPPATVPLGIPRAPLWMLTCSLPAAAPPARGSWQPPGWPCCGGGWRGWGGQEAQAWLLPHHRTPWTCFRAAQIKATATPWGGQPLATTRLPSLVHGPQRPSRGGAGLSAHEVTVAHPITQQGPRAHRLRSRPRQSWTSGPGAPCFLPERLQAPRVLGQHTLQLGGPTTPREAAASRSRQAKQHRPWRQA